MGEAMSRQLNDLLAKDKIITPAQQAAAVEAAKAGKSHIRFLIEQKFVSETKLLYHLSQKFGMPSINLAKFEIPADVLKLVSPDLARKCGAIPIQMSKGTLVVAVCDPTYLSQIEDLKFKTKLNVEAVL